MSVFAIHIKKQEPIESYFSVQADADDGWTWGGNQIQTDWPRVGYQPDDPRHAWMRFTNVTIPQGTTIESAYIKCALYGNQYTAGVTCDIAARDADTTGNPWLANHIRNADAVSPGTDGWYLTTASTSWTIPTGAEDAVLTTPSLTSIIQEIVDRPGWNSGNSIAAVWHGTNVTDVYRTFHRPQDGYASRLYVSYYN